jgi:hydroxymethylpyrimidine/phosphomethylpyrimidine kinase
MKAVLTIAGSDSSGGAGIQADLKTFAAHGVYGMSVITALTAQNTQGVSGVHEVPADFVAQQIDAVVADIPPAAVKTGMLANAGIVEVVAGKLQQYALPNVVVDPVMVAKSGARLLSDEGVNTVRAKLLPVADLLTPNIPEAEMLLGTALSSDEFIRRAAVDIQAMGPKAVLIKGGHQPGEKVVDVLFDGEHFWEFSGVRVETQNTHGTGCTYASAIAAQLALGEKLSDAVRHAREYLQAALERAYPIGHGHGPVHHFWKWWK